MQRKYKIKSVFLKKHCLLDFCSTEYLLCSPSSSAWLWSGSLPHFRSMLKVYSAHKPLILLSEMATDISLQLLPAVILVRHSPLPDMRICVLFATPWTVAHQIPLSMKFYRQEYWSGLPGTEPTSLASPALVCRFFTTATPGKLRGVVYSLYITYHSCILTSLTSNRGPAM